MALLLGVTPGPDNLFVLMQSARRGWRMGLCVVLGLCLGLVERAHKAKRITNWAAKPVKDSSPIHRNGARLQPRQVKQTIQ